MATIVTRSGKGSALTHTEADANFTNLNTDKLEGVSSSTDNAIVRWDGTGGSTLQNTATTTINDNGDIVVGGTTPTITIGDGGEEDAALQFNGVKDFYIASDDSADKLVIGEGSTIGTNSILTITDDSVTLGDGATEDLKLVWDGNAKDFYIGLDDSADKLVIGEGSTVGTNSILTITDDAVTIGDGAVADTYLNFDGNAQDYRIGIDDGTDILEVGVGTAHGTTTALKIDSSAQVTVGVKLIMPDVTAGKILVGDGTSYEEVAVSGDIGLASTGAATIQSTSVESGMVNTNVITGQTEETSIADDDFVLIYDTSATAFRKIQKSNLVNLTTAASVNITTVGDEFSNYDTISSTVTTTVPSNSNGFLMGPITVGSGYSWTIASGSTLNIL